ncbi:YwqJ-related putative deaminase [Streptomyces alanosinicus]|uniref:YwqJ-related putative deaminase n=1 Tax=Streptomyces alanosinicus TaxID=68171 RepID=UPI00227D92B9|nr:YwqJ-related putative deaminase [Streptomyces alanosinicus]
MSSSLLVQGMVLSQTSLVGPGTPNLHPAVLEFVDSLPVETRRRFTGRCAESALVSDQLWEMDSARTDGRSVTLREAASRFHDSALTSRMIREPGNPDHGKSTTPCPVCSALLQELGIRVIG